MILGIFIGAALGIFIMAMVSAQSYQKGFEDGWANNITQKDKEAE